MTDAPKVIWAQPDMATVRMEQPDGPAVPYILAAEHERLLTERDVEIARLRNDCRILLAQIAWLAECTGEGLEAEDAAFVAEIGAALGDDNG